MNKFYCKYNQKQLEDIGGIMSEEYKKYQADFFKELSEIARSLGGRIIKKIKGHYYESAMMQFGDSYIYLSRSSLNRAFINLDSKDEFLIRTAKNSNDWTGGANNYTNFNGITDLIEKLLM